MLNAGECRLLRAKRTKTAHCYQRHAANEIKQAALRSRRLWNLLIRLRRN